MTRIQEAARRLIDKHGSVRKAGVATGIHYSLLHKLASGYKSNPTMDTLEKLGLGLQIRRIRKGNGT